MGPLAAVHRTDAFCLVGASTLAFVLDATGIPMAGVGFVDAHELALVAGILLWSARPRACWHLAAAAVHLLFAAANVAHWEYFVSAHIVAVGWMTTAAHVLFVVLGCLAAHRATASGFRKGEPETAIPTRGYWRGAVATPGTGNGEDVSAGSVKPVTGRLRSEAPLSFTA
jgi:hypothetical protein